jgi:hypothetical protein
MTITPFYPTNSPTIPTPIPGLEPDPLQIITPADMTEGNTLLHDLILFETPSIFPFDYEKYSQKFQGLIGDFNTVGPDNDYRLWAVSPDGKRMGRLTPAGLNTMMFMPQSPSQKPVIVEYDIHLNNSDLVPVSLPEECDAYKTKPVDAVGDFNVCRYFKFSPDGRYLSYTFDEQGCNRTLSILEVSTGKMIYQNLVNSLYPEFLSNGKAFIKMGHCEGGGTLLVDLKTGKEQEAGDYAWEYEWNKPHTALLVQVHPYQGIIGRSFWGYNVQNDTLFSAPQISKSMDSPATWVPAGTHIIFQHREFVDGDSSLAYLPKGSSQIIRKDLESGKNQVILTDPRYDYWLCDQNQPCIFKNPDWVQVKRSLIPTDPGELAIYQAAVLECLDHGECILIRETLALNWRTGELRPWDQVPAAPPTATPTGQYKLRGEDYAPLPPNPGGKLIYINPSGDFAFYVGADGTSLWKVQKNGEPVVWVEYGINFIYLP